MTNKFSLLKDYSPEIHSREIKLLKLIRSSLDRVILDEDNFEGINFHGLGIVQVFLRNNLQISIPDKVGLTSLGQFTLEWFNLGNYLGITFYDENTVRVASTNKNNHTAWSGNLIELDLVIDNKFQELYMV